MAKLMCTLIKYYVFYDKDFINKITFFKKNLSSTIQNYKYFLGLYKYFKNFLNIDLFSLENN